MDKGENDSTLLDEVYDKTTCEKKTPKEKQPETEPDTAKKKAADPEAADDEYSYLKRDEFTSEIFKVELSNLGYFGIGELKKLLRDKLNFDMAKLKSPRGKDFAFVCFRSREDQERALTVLDGYKWKGKLLKASVAKASADPLKKRRNESSETAVPVKKACSTAEATCPLSSLSYEDQLKLKDRKVNDIINTYLKDLSRKNPKLHKRIQNDFKFEGVLPSPQIDGYRNKNEFTVGRTADGSNIVVGFRLGSYANGSVEVSPVGSVPHLPEASKWAAKSFEEFMIHHPKYEPFRPENNVGHIRQLMVRTSAETGEIMLVVGVYTSNLPENELAQLKKELVEFYKNYNSDPPGASAKFNVTSLYMQDLQHRKAGQMISPVEHLSGTTHITDSIQNLKYRISPLAFFQVNTSAADILYQKTIDLAAPKAYSTVLDICCGTGTIALSFAKHCKQVLGVDIIPEAIADAEINAVANGIKNCKFFTGNADDLIRSMVREVLYEKAPNAPFDLVAVVDPPRAGLHNRSITTIRSATAIKRLVYISCNPMRAAKNWSDLGRPQSKQYKGGAFYPKTAVAVDMFPHTDHTELVILFEREEEQNDDPNAVIPSAEAEMSEGEPEADAQISESV